jgi:Fanconi anemia group M protein
MGMIQIDSREDSQLSRHVIDLCDKQNIEYEKIWLEIGDYIIGDCCIEAKSAADFLQSVRNNRIFNQLDNMDRTYNKNIILIYGTLDDAIAYLERTNYNSIKWRTKLKKKFVGALTSIALHTDVKPVWVDSYRTASHIILATVAHIDKELIIHKELPKKIRTDDVRVDVLSEIKGVSVEKAKALLKTFGSIAEIIMATNKEICKLDGIGPKTAANILNALNSEKEVKY